MKSAIDYGLNRLLSVAQPGQTFSCLEIALACGCTKGNIERIERQALRKALQLICEQTQLTTKEARSEFI
jgi:hypothetical protein